MSNTFHFLFCFSSCGTDLSMEQLHSLVLLVLVVMKWEILFCSLVNMLSTTRAIPHCNDEYKAYTQRIHSSSTNVNITEARSIICAIVRNEDLYIHEWVQYHKFIGYDFIQLFDNNINASAVLAELPKIYGENFIRICHVSGIGKQVKSYNYCLEQYRHTNTWATFIDIDEFLVLRRHPNVQSFLSEIGAEGGAISLNRIEFTSNGHIHYENKSVLERFTTRQKKLDPFSKTIAYLPHTTKVNVHIASLIAGKTRRDCHGREILPVKQVSIFNGTEDIAAVNHYFTKSFEEFTYKRRRGFGTNIHQNMLYRGVNGTAHILKDFNKSERKPSVQDFRALDFFRSHLFLEQNQIS